MELHCIQKKIDNITKQKVKTQNKHMNLFMILIPTQYTKNNSVSKKSIPYKSNDNAFEQELTDICHDLVSSGCLISPVQLFTQHNRDNVCHISC